MTEQLRQHERRVAAAAAAAGLYSPAAGSTGTGGGLLHAVSMSGVPARSRCAGSWRQPSQNGDWTQQDMRSHSPGHTSATRVVYKA